MANYMRMDNLRSAVEAAGLAMAPAADQFDGEPAAVERDAAASGTDTVNYSGAWTHARLREGFEAAAPSLRHWLQLRWSRTLSP